MFHDKLGHGTAADVAVTDEEDFYHVEMLLTRDFGTRDYGTILSPLDLIAGAAPQSPKRKGFVFTLGR